MTKINTESYLGYALQVLIDAGCGLSLSELTERVMSLKGAPPKKGKTPNATLASAIGTHIRSEGNNSPFLKDTDGLYWANHTPSTHTPSTQPTTTTPTNQEVPLNQGDFLDEIKKHNSACKSELLQKVLDNHNGFKFEELVSIVLSKMGFEEITLTPKTRDGGVDLRAVSISCGGHMRVRVAIQAKRYNPKLKVSAKEIREIRGSLNPHETGMLITTSSFTKDALDEARAPDKTPISLIDGKSLVDLLVQHEIGAKREMIEVIQLTYNGTQAQPCTPIPSAEDDTLIRPPNISASLSNSHI